MSQTPPPNELWVSRCTLLHAVCAAANRSSSKRLPPSALQLLFPRVKAARWHRCDASNLMWPSGLTKAAQRLKRWARFRWCWGFYNMRDFVFNLTRLWTSGRRTITSLDTVGGSASVLSLLVDDKSSLRKCNINSPIMAAVPWLKKNEIILIFRLTFC